MKKRQIIGLACLAVLTVAVGLYAAQKRPAPSLVGKPAPEINAAY